MKKLLCLAIFVFAAAGASFAQENKMEMKPTDADKRANFDRKGRILRGATLTGAKKVSLTKVLADPSKYAGQNVRIEGVVIRSCKMEGCWMELAPAKDAKSVRVQFKDHRFFIPLQSAGFKARAEGTFEVKKLSKEEVDHLIKDDGAKFDNRNADGSVTEIRFVASGVELRKVE